MMRADEVDHLFFTTVTGVQAPSLDAMLATSPARGAIVPAARAMPWLFGAVVERLAR